MQELVSVIEDESVNWLCAGLKQLQGLAGRAPLEAAAASGPALAPTVSTCIFPTLISSSRDLKHAGACFGNRGRVSQLVVCWFEAAARPKATMLGTSIFLALSRLSETSVGTSSSRDLCIGFIRLDLINSWVKFG